MAFVSDSTDKTFKTTNSNPGPGFYNPYPEKEKLEHKKLPFDSGLDRFLLNQKQNSNPG